MEFLTTSELIELTGKKSCSGQIKELQFLSIPFRTRSDGRPVVHRRDLPLLRDTKKGDDVKLNLEAI